MAKVYRQFRVIALGIMFLFLSVGEALAAGSDKEIRFALQNRIGSAIPLVAVEKGYFAALGLQVKALRFNSGPASAEALYSGSADIGTMGDTTAIISMTRSARLRLLASHGSGEHRHRLVVRKDSPYKELKDLKGKRIAIKKGTSTFGGFLVVLQRQGFSVKDFKIIDLSPGIMPSALVAGSVAAIAASEPTPSLVELTGGREIATFGGTGNQYPLLLLAQKRFLTERPADVARFLQALSKAEVFIARNPEAAAQILARVTGLPDHVALQAMQLHSYRLRLDRQIFDSLNATAEFLLQQKYIEQVPDFTGSSAGFLTGNN